MIKNLSLTWMSIVFYLVVDSAGESVGEVDPLGSRDPPLASRDPPGGLEAEVPLLNFRMLDD